MYDKVESVKHCPKPFFQPAHLYSLAPQYTILGLLVSFLAVVAVLLLPLYGISHHFILTVFICLCEPISFSEFGKEDKEEQEEEEEEEEKKEK